MNRSCRNFFIFNFLFIYNCCIKCIIFLKNSYIIFFKFIKSKIKISNDFFYIIFNYIIFNKIFNVYISKFR